MEEWQLIAIAPQWCIPLRMAIFAESSLNDSSPAPPTAPMPPRPTTSSNWSARHARSCAAEIASQSRGKVLGLYHPADRVRERLLERRRFDPEFLAGGRVVGACASGDDPRSLVADREPWPGQSLEDVHRLAAGPGQGAGCREGGESASGEVAKRRVQVVPGDVLAAEQVASRSACWLVPRRAGQREPGTAGPGPRGPRAGTLAPPGAAASPRAALPGSAHGTARAWQTWARGVPSRNRVIFSGRTSFPAGTPHSRNDAHRSPLVSAP